MTSIALSPVHSLARLPGADNARSVLAFEHGTLTFKLYAPRGRDPQQPHTRGDAYVVGGGSGTFVHGERRNSFAAGDFLFAPAGSRPEAATTPHPSSALFSPRGGEKGARSTLLRVPLAPLARGEGAEGG